MTAQACSRSKSADARDVAPKCREEVQGDPVVVAPGELAARSAR
jgi:hypothetical protein